jgi:hypothetical protein
MKLNAIVALLLAGVVSLAAAQQPEKGLDKSPPPPEDAQWTILCRTFAGPDRVALAMRTRDALRKQSGEKTWYLLHGEQDTSLFYGYYRSVTTDVADNKARKDAERAASDRRRIAAMRDERGNALFPEAIFVPVDAVGEDGPREWSITAAPRDAQWSLLIGVYQDIPQRKRAAVDAVRKLRSEKVEAWYFHGDIKSYVYVGSWDAAAVTRTEIDTAKLSQSPDEQVMVTDRFLDPSVPTVYRTHEGKTVRLAARTLTIHNQDVKDTQKKFPHFHTNGEVLGRKIKDPKTKQERVVYDESVLCAIPRREQTVLNSDTLSAPPPVQILRPPGASPTPGSGKLKSIDD